MVRAGCFAVVCVVWAGLAAGAQVESPASRLETASALTSLDTIDQPAWHLKLDVTLFDGKGKNPREGSIEVWHAGTDEKVAYVFGDASSAMLKHDGKTFYSGTRFAVPFEAEEVLLQFLHPGPGPAEGIGAVPELRKQKFGKSKLDCVMLTQPIGGALIPLGLFPTYCLDTGGIIRVTYNFGGHAVILDRVGTFLHHEVPIVVLIQEGEVEVASAKIVALSTYTPQPDDFVPGADMAAEGGSARVAGGVIAGDRVGFVEPGYPVVAKMRHESGTVILHAIIGRDGHVHSLRPLQWEDSDFVIAAIAAIAAVRFWTYKPYLLNGVPTEVDTTITVNFRIN